MTGITGSRTTRADSGRPVSFRGLPLASRCLAIACLLLLGGGAARASASSPPKLQDPAPQVTVVFPNGGEVLAEYSQVKLLWSASGGTGALPVDLFISIDDGGSYQTIATSQPNTGSYVWFADPALATNGRCQNPVYSALLKVVAHSADGTPGEDVSDAPFSIFHITECADPPCCVASPSVTVIKPNGPADDLLVGSDAHLQWAASGSYSAALAGIDLYMSKDLGASYQLIASGLDNTGDYLWHVDPAFATNSGSATIDSALFMAVAHDQVGRSAHDVSDAPFSIFDATVPTTLSLFRASALPGGVELRWRFDDSMPVKVVTVERASSAVGPWRALNAEVRRDGEESVALDQDVTVGQRCFYRLRATLANGQAGVFGLASASAGGVAPNELGSVGPSPSVGGPVRIEYSVAQRMVIRLSIVDLQGRRVAVLRSGVQPPGRYEAVWSPGKDVRSGIYFVRYETAGRSVSRRIAVTN